MWKDYSAGYLKHNRASGRSIMAAAFIASFFLSLLCCIAYNLQVYDMEKAALAAGESQFAGLSMLRMVYAGILTIAVISLILIIRGSFELSMQARIHQFGIFSSVGATPKQIRLCLLQEAAALCFLPAAVGLPAGMAVCYGLIEAVNFYAADMAGRIEAVFHYHPGVFVVTVASVFVTVLFSAWLPAKKLSRMTPLEAIRGADGLKLRKRGHSRILALIFGIEGELAGNALKAQRKSLRISALSLLLSFLGFSIMLTMLTLSDISTRFTYFERYQDAWDVMVTVKGTGAAELAAEIRNISGVRDATVYQRAESTIMLPEAWQSGELISLGGLETLAGIPKEENGYQVTAPIIVMDDVSFQAYCEEIGISPRLDGAVVINKIWDSAHSNFRYREYVPFMREDVEKTIEIPVLAYTETAPLLREEYADYGLVHVMSVSLWEAVAEKAETAGLTEAESYIRILGDENADLAELTRLEEEVAALISGFAVNTRFAWHECDICQYDIVESENRLQEKQSNDNMINGMKIILGGLCVLLAVIGIANVFSCTLGFLRGRKREFAQYMSVGLTPEEMRKMFCIEAFVIAGKPLLVTAVLTVLFTEFALRASYLDRAVFMGEAPVMPILLFGAAIVLFVALAYYIGGRRILRCDLGETLRSDMIM